MGADLYKIDTDATGVSSAPAASESSASTEDVPADDSSSEGTRQEVPVPVMGESISQGVLAAWNKGVGDFVNADEVVATIETDKVTIDVNSPFTGKIVEILAEEGAEIEVGGPLFVVMEGAGGAPKASSKPTPAKDVSTPVSTPAPSAPVPKATSTPTPTASPSTTTPAEEKSVGNRSESRVKMTRMRQRIAQRLKESQNTAAMLTTFQEV